MKYAPTCLSAACLALGLALPAAAQVALIGGAIGNGDLDQTYAQEIVPGFFLPKPTVWTNEGSRAISGPYEDEMSSEPWAGPAPTPVTTNGSGLPIPGGCAGLDCAVFFKPFSGNAANGAATGHLYQDLPATPGASYVLTAWAGAEANAQMGSAEIALEFLDSASVVIPGSGQVVDLLPTLTVPNGEPFSYKEYTATGVAPANAVSVRARVSMIDALANPQGGGQAFVVDDFTLTEEGGGEIFSDGFESGSICSSLWSDWSGADCGEHCDAGTCPDGCCASNVCTSPTVSSCGIDGDVCLDCGIGADSCTSGACACGAGPACAAGVACIGGVCACTATSCPDGCCDGNICMAPSLATCGLGGGSCLDCGIRADSCTSGACVCGAGPACAPGQECIGGGCFCTPDSCPDGCCDGNSCRAPSPTTCGIGGSPCSSCGFNADGCTSGVCTCGGSPACAPGQGCIGGSCCGLPEAACDPEVPGTCCPNSFCVKIGGGEGICVGCLLPGQSCQFNPNLCCPGYVCNFDEFPPSCGLPGPKLGTDPGGPVSSFSDLSGECRGPATRLPSAR